MNDVIKRWPDDYRREPAPGFGAELAGILARLGMSYKQAASHIGCDHSYVSRLVSRDRIPTIDMIEDIARTLRLTERERLRLIILAGYIPREMASELLAEIDRRAA